MRTDAAVVVNVQQLASLDFPQRVKNYSVSAHVREHHALHVDLQVVANVAVVDAQKVLGDVRELRRHYLQGAARLPCLQQREYRVILIQVQRLPKSHHLSRVFA